MSKPQFGDLLRSAREAKDLSLRHLANCVDIDYSRLSKIEGGTRPAPGLAEIRKLSETLDLDMVDLLVAAGTSREVMEYLLWSERLHADRSDAADDAYVPERSPLLVKNTYRVLVLDRNGALCTVELGACRLAVFAFSDAPHLSICIPPEAVTVHREAPELDSSTVENVMPARLKKIRRLGQVTNLVLAGEGFELNTLHTGRRVARIGASEGDVVFATVQATAIRTESAPKEA